MSQTVYARSRGLINWTLHFAIDALRASRALARHAPSVRLSTSTPGPLFQTWGKSCCGPFWPRGPLPPGLRWRRCEWDASPGQFHPLGCVNLQPVTAGVPLGTCRPETRYRQTGIITLTKLKAICAGFVLAASSAEAQGQMATFAQREEGIALPPRSLSFGFRRSESK